MSVSSNDLLKAIITTHDSLRNSISALDKKFEQKFDALQGRVGQVENLLQGLANTPEKKAAVVKTQGKTLLRDKVARIFLELFPRVWSSKGVREALLQLAQQTCPGETFEVHTELEKLLWHDLEDLRGNFLRKKKEKHPSSFQMAILPSFAQKVEKEIWSNEDIAGGRADETIRALLFRHFGKHCGLLVDQDEPLPNETKWRHFFIKSLEVDFEAPTFAHKWMKEIELQREEEQQPSLSPPRTSNPTHDSLSAFRSQAFGN